MQNAASTYATDLNAVSGEEEEGSEPDDNYYFESEIFFSLSAKVYDPYDLKGVNAPTLSHGDNETREAFFRPKYLDYCLLCYKASGKDEKTRPPRSGVAVTSGGVHETLPPGLCVQVLIIT